MVPVGNETCDEPWVRWLAANLWHVHGGLSCLPMATTEPDGLDAPACPLLGLAADRRSHFTSPHPGHRCFAKKNAATTEALLQSTYCLSLAFATCDRYRAWQRQAESCRGGGTESTAGG